MTPREEAVAAARYYEARVRRIRRNRAPRRRAEPVSGAFVWGVLCLVAAGLVVAGVAVLM